VKGYVFVSDANSKLQMPKEARKTDLYLMHPYILLQIKILNKAQFHFEVAITDTNGRKKRLIWYGATPYAYTKSNLTKQPMYTRIPSNMVLEGVWLNLQFDIPSFVEKCCDDSVFASIDSITINGPCLVRRIFTCKAQVPDSFAFVIEREFGE